MTSLVLVQCDPSQRLPSGEFKITLEIGSLKHDASGYRFLPHSTARKPSRKSHSSMFKAIPKWAQELAEAKGFADLLTREEIKEAIARWPA